MSLLQLLMMHKYFIFSIVLFLSVSPIPGHTTSFTLSLPIDCEVGEECHIQNYVDMLKGNQWGDYRCGNLSYDKHKGTDFTIPSKRLHNNPVPVLAAAEGIVLGMRNNKQDIHIRSVNEDYANTHIKGSECGNGLVIQHHDGWQTQYCHMKQGSITVKSGQKVKRGEILGHVGLSGKTEFPHLHLSVRKDEKPVDPFTSIFMEHGCNHTKPTKNIWDANAQSQLGHPTTAIVDFGIKHNLPIDAISARSGNYRDENFNKNTKEALLWIDILRPTKGDVIEITLPYPDKEAKRFTHTIEKTQARRFQYMGTKSPPQWTFEPHISFHPSIHFKLIRDDKIIDQKIMSYPIKQ